LIAAFVRSAVPTTVPRLALQNECRDHQTPYSSVALWWARRNKRHAETAAQGPRLPLAELRSAERDSPDFVEKSSSAAIGR
jgi:hypothetical protein